MSGLCKKCGSDLSTSKSIIKCADCNLQFHNTCTNAVATTAKGRGRTWKCESCAGETTSLQSDTGSDTRDSISQLLQTMKTEIINEFRNEIRALTEECRKNNARISVIEAEQGDLKNKCVDLERSNNELRNENRDLRRQARDADQHSRAANLEIQGVPATPQENLIAFIQQLASKLLVPFTPEDISIAHRLRLYSNKHKYPPIIVQFVSRAVREKWLFAARRNRGLQSTDIATSLRPSTIYINEHLTSHNKSLLGRARRLLREKKLSFAGFFNGKVLVKKKPEDDATRIFEIADLDEFDT